MAISTTAFCLPPDAFCDGGEERVRGSFTIRLLSLSWGLPRLIPAHLEAAICFSCNSQQISLPFPLSAGHDVHVPIVSPPAAFDRYLRDLQSLYIPIKDLTNGADGLFASVVLPVDGLDLMGPQIQHLPVHADNKRCLGHIEVLLEARFNNPLSRHIDDESFELSRERLVSTAAQRNSSVDLDAETMLDDIETCSKSGAAGTNALAPEVTELLPLVYAAIQRRRWQGMSAFRQLDQNKSGKLDAEDSVRLVEKLVPFQLSPAQRCYLRFMLDVSGTKEFTFQLLTSALKDCRDAALLHRTSENRRVGSRMSSAAFDIQQRTLELGKMFRQRSETEQLPVPEIIAIFAQLIQNWDQELQRIFLAKAYHLLPHITNQASLNDVKHVFRTIIMEQSQPWVYSNAKEGSKSHHRAHKLDAARLTGDVRNQQHAAAVTNSSPSGIQDSSCASPRKPSNDQTSRIQNRATRQTQRMQGQTSQTFETEYNEICNLLAACQSTPGSRQHRRIGASNIDKPEVQPRLRENATHRHFLHPHLQSLATEPGLCRGRTDGKSIHTEEYDCGHKELPDPTAHGDVIDVLLNRALHLKHLIASVSSSVQDMHTARPVGYSAADRHSGLAGSPASQKAQDVVDLAALKALTSSQHSVTYSAKGKDDHPNVAMHVAECGVDVHEESIHLGPCTSSAEHPGDGNGAQPVASSCIIQRQGLRGDADVTAHLSVSQVHSVVLSGTGEMLMSSAREPAFWLTWRMPGSVGMRPWLMLKHLQGSVFQSTASNSTYAYEPDTTVVSEVFLTTSSLRAIKALGQPITMQCELWLFDGPDPTQAMANGVNALIGLLSVPLHLQGLPSGQVELAHGIYMARNVLEGFTGAQLRICITANADAAALLLDVLPTMRQPSVPPAHNNENRATFSCSANCGNVGLNQDQILSLEDSIAASHTINHEFKVHMLSITQLPCQEASSASNLPVARYLRYTFPCDDQALYTQDIPVTAEHQFEDATFALHRIALPMEAPILKHLVREACTDEEDSVCLCFEVFDCFEEDTCAQDAVCFKGTLSVKTILQTTKLNETMWEKVAVTAASQSTAPQVFSSQNRFHVILNDVKDSVDPVLFQSPPTVLIDVQYSCELILAQPM